MGIIRSSFSFMLGMGCGVFIAQNYEVPNMKKLAKEWLSKADDWEKTLRKPKKDDESVPKHLQLFAFPLYIGPPHFIIDSFWPIQPGITDGSGLCLELLSLPPSVASDVTVGFGEVSLSLLYCQSISFR
ncbi:hypothetical protein Cni_G09394 [Canna indica]|uniref:UBC core domain-containing protein n=1 Tax=Canna indica TaxID=4628 RepID=A0AAQ3Q6F3_9LILI|nr:hypothetical protein Cni_G09394 [Canna indica]